MSIEPAFVEFVFRVHADGRRERSAEVYVRREDGKLVTATGRLEGEIGAFAAEAVAEATQEGGGVRRVPIDGRSFPPARRRRSR